MERYFKTQEGKLVNIVEHTLEQIEKWPNLKIYVGTDSQDKDNHSHFATVIVYRYGTRGAHFIYLRDSVPRFKVMYNRLFDEAVRTIEVAQLLTADIPVAIEGLEFDYNHIKNFKSNRLLADVKGWVQGLQMTPVFKSGQMIACKAADHVVRHLDIYK